MPRISAAEIEARQKIFAWAMIILAFVVAVIIISQIVFWIAVVAFFAAIIYLIASFFLDLDWFFMEDYTLDKVVAVVLIGGLWIVASISFTVGYSPTSQKILEFAGQVEELQGLPLQITLEAIDDACTDTPTLSCDQLKSTLKLADSIEDVSNTAKFVQKVFNIKVDVPTSN